MKRLGAWMMAGVAALSLGVAYAADPPKSGSRGVMEADRAGWILGMFVGEQKGHPYPFVTQLDPKGEAKLKGVRPGDEIIRFNDEEVREVQSLFKRVNKLRPGKDVTFWVRRGAQTIQVQMRVPKSHSPVVEPEKKDAKKDETPKAPVVVKPVPTPEDK